MPSSRYSTCAGETDRQIAENGGDSNSAAGRTTKNKANPIKPNHAHTRCSNTATNDMAKPDQPAHQRQVDREFSCFKSLSLPMNHEKCEGRATSFVFRDVVLNSLAQTARLMDVNVQRLPRGRRSA